MDTYTKQVSELVAGVCQHDEQIMLLGFSMGGIVATEFAVRHPKKVAKLLLVAPAGLLDKSQTPCAPLLFKGLRGPLGGLLVFLATLIGGLFGFAFRSRMTFELDVREPEKFTEVSKLNNRRFFSNVRRSIGSYLRVLRRMPMWAEDFAPSYEKLARSPVPVLFIWGDADNTVPWSEAEEHITGFFGPRGTSCIRVANAGHGLLLEDAAQVGMMAGAWFANEQDYNWKDCLDMWRLPNPGPAVGTSAAEEAAKGTQLGEV